MDKPTSIKRLPLPIPVKLPKEVNEILKYFKKTGPAKLDNNVIRQECGQTWTRVRVWTSIYCSDNY